MIVRSRTDLEGTNRETRAHDKNHQETVYCIEGNATLTDHTNGEVYAIAPGTMSVLDQHEKHTLDVEETVRMICVFTPALVGQEVHDDEGAYPLITAERSKV